VAGDADGVAALYADGASFRSAPFRTLQPPREYAAAAFDEEEDVECRFGEPFVAGDRAAVEYWATLREDGSDVTIAGVALIRFDADGQVVDQRDYWHLEEGRREPPAGWGR
jgi:hypothetical protein